MRKQSLMVAVVLSAGLAGCSSSASRDTAGPRVGSDPGPAATAGVAASAARAPIGARVIRFAFDSAQLDREGERVVQQWATYLNDNPQARVRLEGHADERGTREYNMALGERRAKAVQQALVTAGASAGQLKVVSYGEERPAAEGNDETAWQQNRRVEIAQ